MTEIEFWAYLNMLLSKGRMDMRAGLVECGKPGMNEVEVFISSHALLPKGYESLSLDNIRRMGMLLFRGKVQLRTKQAVLILLAHHPSKEALAILEKFSLSPDQGLRIFSELALDECRMWNDERSCKGDFPPVSRVY
ncbi:MAG: hypothetical protein PHH68_06340 [Candidatus Omnitrophica bacterium]|jgi:hypothetical protein|nr:hypothetical protein [Candidatus Omnitrophota bacterium]MDD5079924.1 hypothetical protein [Candidatus Omnitrophota bacterium]